MESEHKSKLDEMRSELAPRNLIGRLVGSFGGFFLVCGLSAPIYSHGHDLGVAALLFGLGVLFVFCAVLLLRPSRVEGKPPFWFPAMSGLLCSCCVLALVVLFAIVWKTPKGQIPKSVAFLTLFAAVGCVLSAIVCVITALSAFMQARGMKQETSDRSAKTIG